MKKLDALNFCFSKHLVDSHLPDATPECDEMSLFQELPMSSAKTTADSSMLSLTDVSCKLVIEVDVNLQSDRAEQKEQQT